jgi:predicted phosphodiesterase
MRVAIISDVHSNHEALKSVLADIQRRAIPHIVCLGDLVGYSCFPRETLALLRRSGIPSVCGNHDLMAIGRLEPVECGPNARIATFWTRSVLSRDDKDYLQSLPSYRRLEPDVMCVHSGLGDPVMRLRRPENYLDQYTMLRQFDPNLRICFTGHTHTQVVVRIGPDAQIAAYRRREFRLAEHPSSFYFVNPGSVGHPRGPDSRAGYAIYDSETGTVSFQRVAYDREAVVQANATHGLKTDLGSSVAAYYCKRLGSAFRMIKTVAKRHEGKHRREP